MTYQAQWRWRFYPRYTDDICLLVVGKFPNMVSGLALSTLQIWCNDKTGLVAFTRKRKLQGFFEPQLFGVKLSLSGLVKYLSVILDSRLAWREHVEVTGRLIICCGPVEGHAGWGGG
jgi:hypothetical protein